MDHLTRMRSNLLQKFQKRIRGQDEGRKIVLPTPEALGQQQQLVPLYIGAMCLKVAYLLFGRLSPQRARGPDGKLSGVPETNAVPSERDRPRPAQTSAHIWKPFQAG